MYITGIITNFGQSDDVFTPGHAPLGVMIKKNQFHK